MPLSVKVFLFVIVAYVALVSASLVASNSVASMAEQEVHQRLSALPNMQASYVERNVSDCLYEQTRMQVQPNFFHWRDAEFRKTVIDGAIPICVEEFVLEAETVVELSDRNALLATVNLAPFSQDEVAALSLARR